MSKPFDLPIAPGSERIMTDEMRLVFEKFDWYEKREPLVRELLAQAIEKEGLVEGQRDESCAFCQAIADLRDFPMPGAGT